MENVLDLAVADNLAPKRVTIGEYQSPCPGCGGKNRFCIYPDQNDKGDGNGPRGSYHCGHGHEGNGCGKGGDNIQYLRDFRGMDYRQACAHLGLTPRDSNDRAHYYRPVKVPRKQRKRFVPRARAFPNSVTDPARWQVHGEKFVDCCHHILLTHEKSLKWLAERGIPLAAVKKYKLGLHEGQTRGGRRWQPGFRPCESWGIKGGKNPKTGRPQVFVLPAGIVVPWFVDGRLMQIKVRLARPAPDEPRYRQIKGSAQGTWLTRPGAKCFVVVETELDGIMIDHQTADLTDRRGAPIIGTVGLGSVSNRPDTDTTAALKQAVRILNAVDYDRAGARSVGWWRKNFPNSQRWPVPKGKDPGEAFQQGVDIRRWIRAGLPSGLQTTLRELSLPETPTAPQAVHPMPVGDFSTLEALLQESRTLIRIYDNRGGTALEFDQRWESTFPDKARWLSQLVYFSDPVWEKLSRLPDGIYTAQNLQHEIKRIIRYAEKSEITV